MRNDYHQLIHTLVEGKKAVKKDYNFSPPSGDLFKSQYFTRTRTQQSLVTNAKQKLQEKWK
jgi:hypothetical protein